MSIINMKLYYDNRDIINTSYVTICAGKGKEKHSQLFIEKTSFSYIEGLIWDKHREYGVSKKTKISSKDWQRIIDGMIIAKNKLTSMNGDETKNVLKFGIFNPKNPISEITNQMADLTVFLEEFIEWISGFTQTEKYIFIIKNEV